MKSAAHLSASAVVAKTVANAFPLILVDEFQDCTGSQLSLIANLREYVDLILAADPFQALDGDESACEWARGLEGQEFVQVTHLKRCERTDCHCLLEAADALLENRLATYSGDALPFFFAPRYDLAVWKVLSPHPTTGLTAALIYPAHRSLTNLENSAKRQSEKRLAAGKNPIRLPWHTQVSDADLAKQTQAGFTKAIREGAWKQNGKWLKLYEEAQYLSKAKGHINPPEKFFEYVVKSFVQARKFVAAQPIKFEATTVHGAKNREFDQVYVLWDNNLCANMDNEQKRRRLYNAITRARTSGTVIAIGSEKQVGKCPVLSLLGTPASCFRT
jgi:superfamily I DNA/RNA helicase